MKLFLTEPAIQDLRDLRDYIAADSDFHAADFIASINTRAEREFDCELLTERSTWSLLWT
jgi:plasmid stabilization system protein ParE